MSLVLWIWRLLCSGVRPDPAKEKKNCPKYDTKLYLVGRLQFWSSGKYGILLHYHYPQVSSMSRSVWRLFVLDRNTLYHITVSKLFVLNILAWNNNSLLRIIIISYLKPYNCTNKCWLLNLNNYFKPYNYAQVIIIR